MAGCPPLARRGPWRIPNEWLQEVLMSNQPDRPIRPPEAVKRLAVYCSIIYLLFWEGKLRGVKITRRDRQDFGTK